MSLEDCRGEMPLGAVWKHLGLPGGDKVAGLSAGSKEAKICSPFRDDKSPSFSVWINADGVGFCKDHGSGEKAFDEVGLIERAKSCNNTEAIKLYHEMAGVEWRQGGGDGSKKKKFTKKKVAKKSTNKKSPEAKSVDKVEVKAEKKAPQKLGKLVQEYDYKNAQGELAHQTLRFEPKAFRQRRPATAGDTNADGNGWVWTLKDSDVFPYHLPELLASDKKAPVFLVEGEKDVENMERAGLVATTLPMGAGKWRPEYARWFSGRWVVVVPDFDPVGKNGMRVGEEGARLVAAKLLDFDVRVGILELGEIWKGCQEGCDISDWLEDGWENEVYVEDQRKVMLDLADLAGVPEELAYEGCLVDEDSTVAVFEDRLARRLVKVGGYMYCGSAFWQWKKAGGLWYKMDGRLMLEKKAREAMRAANAEKKISHSKVKSIVGLAESENFCTPEDLNQQPGGWLCVKNGMLDVMSGELHPHRPQYLTTVQCPHEYTPGEDCPAWKEWLAERQPDEDTQRQIQEMFGYCLVTDVNYHSFFFLYGDGGTGKSTCVKVLEELVGGDNIKSMELEDLDNPFTRAGLVGKSLYLCKELTASSFKHIGLIKAIVSGDRISADVKYGRGFDFIPRGRLVMESNVIAATPDSSSGFSRRFIQISWDKQIEVYKYGVEEKLMEEVSGILNWALEGYRRLRERGRFEHTDRSSEATRQLLLHRAQVPSFLDSERVTDHGADDKRRVNVGDVFQAYQNWSEDNDVVAFYKDRPAFMRELMARKPAWRKRKKQVWLEGDRTYVLEGVQVSGLEEANN